MNRKVLFNTLALIVGVMLVVTVVYLAKEAQPVQAKTHNAIDTIVQGWQQVNVDGFGDENNVEALRLAVHNNYLFASTENPDTGGEVWRSANGVDWNKVNLSGFGIISNTIAFVEDSFDGFLYAGTRNTAAGAEIWRCSSCDGTDWTRVVSGGFGDANNGTVQRVIVFSDTLYATVDNWVTGVEVWKSPTGITGSWTQNNIDGFGNPQNGGAWAAAVLDNYLYVATAIADGWSPPNTFGIEVWRTGGDDNWVKVTPEGFGGGENIAWDLSQADGNLYLSLGNFSGAQVWRCVICDGSDWEHLVDGGFGEIAFGTVILEHRDKLVAVTSNNWTIGEHGIDIWKSTDGVNWSQLSSQGFGDLANAKVGTGALEIYNGNLYLGTQNYATGTEIWQMLNLIYLPLTIR